KLPAPIPRTAASQAASTCDDRRPGLPLGRGRDGGQRRGGNASLPGPDRYAPVGGNLGPQRQKPDRLQGDRGYYSEPVRQSLCWLGITPVLAAPYTELAADGGVPLVRGADHLLAACVWAAATPLGPPHGDPGSVPPTGLCPYLFALLWTMTSFVGAL